MKSDFLEVDLANPPSNYKTNIAKVHPLFSLAQELVIRGFSPRTIKSYLEINKRFLEFAGKSARAVSARDIKDFLLYLRGRGQSNSSLNLAISALKFYYQQLLKRKLFFNIQRPKREKFLPTVLSKEEIVKLINSLANLKHRLIIALAYSAGLRVSEVVNLKVKDVDLNNLTLMVRGAKGNKDRMTVFSEKIKNDLRVLSGSKNKNDFLFAEKAGNKLTTRTIQKIFANALRLSGIAKSATFHSLRHSFATHLLEQGVDLRYLQTLLGHQNIKTTQGYTQVTNPHLKGIRSPF
ncbi:tyrosine-type recombinase/integrase [Patescibacteria group bacterium]|nr:tyrosine-type recombinase/integrase [Patescibacteria group bacterium]